MGIRTDPGYKLLLDQCPLCFATGATPKKLFCYISGVSKGPGAPDPGPAAPNGMTILEHVAGCQWLGFLGSWTVEYTTVNEFSVLQAGWAGWAGFIGVEYAPCIWSFAGQAPGDPAEYYGGIGIIVVREIV